MNTPDNKEIKNREHNARASVADGWHRREAPLRKGAEQGFPESLAVYTRIKAAPCTRPAGLLFFI